MNALLFNRIFRENGYGTILLEGKAAIQKNWQKELTDLDEQEWLIKRHRYNYGVLLDGVVVVDKDAASKKTTSRRVAYEWQRHYRIHRSDLEVATNKGIHFFFQGETQTKLRHLGMPLDILSGRNRYVVGPGSMIAGKIRQIRKGEVIPKCELPAFPKDVIQEKKHLGHVSAIVNYTKARTGKILYPEKYAMEIESVQGQHGSKGLVRCVCVLRDAGRSPEETFAFLFHTWNPAKAVPPWSEQEITYAIRRHFQ